MAASARRHESLWATSQRVNVSKCRESISFLVTLAWLAWLRQVNDARIAIKKCETTWAPIYFYLHARIKNMTSLTRQAFYTGKSRRRKTCYFSAVCRGHLLIVSPRRSEHCPCRKDLKQWISVVKSGRFWVSFKLHASFFVVQRNRHNGAKKLRLHVPVLLKTENRASNFTYLGRKAT